MRAALGTDALITLEVLLPDDLPAALALQPQPFGTHVARTLLWSGGRFFALEPGHGKGNGKSKVKSQKAKIKSVSIPAVYAGFHPP